MSTINIHVIINLIIIKYHPYNLNFVINIILTWTTEEIATNNFISNWHKHIILKNNIPSKLIIIKYK